MSGWDSCLPNEADAMKFMTSMILWFSRLSPPGNVERPAVLYILWFLLTSSAI